jgi:hypothetical protein
MKLRILLTLFASFALSGCPLEGDDGTVGLTGSEGPAGINCWDTNENRENDIDEDINKDGVWTAADCSATTTATVAPQNQEVDLTHQHFCEAFADLGRYPEGCPSSTHTPPTGTLVKMEAGQFDGSYQTCSDLSIDTRSEDGTNKAYWLLQGGYIADTETFSLADRAQCETKCNNDTNCVAAYYLKTNGLDSGVCNIMYHSDTISPYEHICGADLADLTAADICLNFLGNTTDWYALCP